MIRVKGILAEIIYGLFVNHICKILVVPYFNLLYLVRSTETIEEVNERKLPFDR
jgi:hypothetical protein